MWGGVMGTRVNECSGWRSHTDEGVNVLLGVMYTKMAMKTKDVKREIKIGNWDYVHKGKDSRTLQEFVCLRIRFGCALIKRERTKNEKKKAEWVTNCYQRW